MVIYKSANLVRVVRTSFTNRNLFKFLIIACLCLISSSAYSQAFGKLFTTPEERQYLDDLRAKFLQRSEQEGFNIEQVIPLAEEEIADESAEFHMAGVIKRKNGGRAVWLNGTTVNEQDLPKNIKLVEVNGQQVLKIAANSKIYYLKSGQTLELETGKVRESFEERQDEPLDIRGSIANVLTGGKSNRSNNTKAKSDNDTKAEPLGINNIIDALQTIQETTGAK